MAALRAGDNIAIKIPAHKHAETVAFYRDAIGLPLIEERADTVLFRFGSLTLWLDRIEHQSQTDVWLEVKADDVEGATERLRAAGATVRDGIEPLEGVRGHWISDPAGVVLLVAHEED